MLGARSVIPRCKIVFIGASGVGKSAIIHRYLKGEFLREHQSTIGAGFSSFRESVNGSELDLYIWDTASLEKYSSLLPYYWRNSSYAIAVYNAQLPDTFREMKEGIRTFYKYNNKNSLVYVVCNKIDLPHDVNVVEDGRQYASKYNYGFCETSALDGTGITELFKDITKNILSNSLYEYSSEGNVVSGNKKNKKSRCCK